MTGLFNLAALIALGYFGNQVYGVEHAVMFVAAAWLLMPYGPEERE